MSAPTALPQSISVVGLKKFFGVTRALDGCNFSANLGEIHAIVGGNGCGKSTLAKVLSGVLPADGGRVTVLGRTAATPYEARHIGIATVFQEVLVADECSVVDNLFMGSDGLFSQSMTATAKLREADALMRDLAGAPVDVQGLAGTLPLGLKQWITIGRALLRRPRVLILDESSAALDLDSTDRLFAKMRELRDRGSTVLIVTHRIAELIRISDRATVLRDGRDVGVLEKADITERNLLALMTGKSDHGKSDDETPGGATARAAQIRQSDVVLRTRGLKLWPGSDPIDFDLHRGEILGVAGLDGQGQSEFVRILAGVEAAAAELPQVRKPDGGFAPIRDLADARERGVAYVSGDRKREGIFANLSIFENMMLPLYRAKSRGGPAGVIDWRALESTFNSETETLQIKMGSRNNKITSLSGGNQQKVLIGRGFALHPDIMILNDPARGIDVGAKAELYRHLLNFAAQGKSVIYMSSELEEFIGFCSRVIVFRHGAVFDEFDAAELDPATILASMFGQTAGMAARGHRAERADAVVRDAEASAPSAPGPAASGWASGLEGSSRSPVASSAPAAISLQPARPVVVGPIKIVEFDGGGRTTAADPLGRRSSR